MEKQNEIFSDNLTGLSSEKAQSLFAQYGPNSVTEKNLPLFSILIKKFWAPIPWMLEITIVLQLMIGKIHEAIVILSLLIFNSLLSFFQEERANKALALLRQHLAIKARVLRDNRWQMINAEGLVPGDIVYLRMGDIVPADIRLLSGNLLLDQSILTGESLPIEAAFKTLAYSGSLIKRGEAKGQVENTGKQSYFGKTAELVNTIESQSHIKNIVFTIIKYLLSINSLLAIGVLVFALINQLSIAETIPFILVLLVASIPAALPATFTLATVLGAHHLTAKNVLVTRLSAIEEAAVMDTICLDKTGTITLNQLQLADAIFYSPFSKEDLFEFALLASDEATQDPIDMAIFAANDEQKLVSVLPKKMDFVPFEPAKKCTEVIFALEGVKKHVIKGAPEVIAEIINDPIRLLHDVEMLAEKGYRVIATAVRSIEGDGNFKKRDVKFKKGDFSAVGLIALYDPPREDSSSSITNLQKMGIHVQMVTGDSLGTARSVAARVGIGMQVCKRNILDKSSDNEISRCDVFAEVFPEDKYNLVKSLQRMGHVTGMTGDGVNDAPSLKQAEVGIAVANATDVAKASASVILTKPGLDGIIAAIETSRRIHKRMLTYILNKIAKSFEIAVFLCLGVMLTKTLIITPLLMVLLLFFNDFATMSIATDNVPFSPKPEKWRMLNLMIGAGALAVTLLIFSFSVFFFCRNYLHLPLTQLQTLSFLLLAFTGQGTMYLVRERRHLWSSWPSKWVLISSLFGIVGVSFLAMKGIFMAALGPSLVLILLVMVIGYLLLVDLLKVRMFLYLGII